MVVGSPNVDQLLEIPLQLAEMISHVRGKVSGLAVVADEHTVLFIAKCGGAKPERPTLLVNMPCFIQ